ncbi:MAG TPA: response regulator transcription factor [Clostridiales bacterium]|nr:response regulator transcription factor [Clostridiales bacterium]
MRRILLVDDEPAIIKGLKFALETDGYEIDSAADGEEALQKALENEYDLILLDVMLPGMSGIEVCQAIREKSDVPIIMLTAKGEDMDKILGLEYGADDYMTKPFNVLEVKARIKSVLRRTASKEPEHKQKIEINGIVINMGNRSVVVNDRPVNLTVKEFDLLYLFMSNPGKVYTRNDLLEQVWGNDYSGDLRTVDVHIRRLREKIEEDPAKPVYIITKWGVGYFFAQ